MKWTPFKLKIALARLQAKTDWAWKSLRANEIWVERGEKPFYPINELRHTWATLSKRTERLEAMLKALQS